MTEGREGRKTRAWIILGSKWHRRAKRRGRAVFAAPLLFCALAAPAAALTLEEALVEAARTNPTLRAARESARALHQGVPLAISAWLPTVRVEARGAGAFDAGATGDALSRNDAAPWSMGVTWDHNLFRGGGDAAALRGAVENVRRSHALVENAEQTLFLQVATAFLDVIRAERAVEVREASLSSFDARVRETEAQFRVGDRTRADVAQARAEREVAVADAASTRAALEIQRGLFESLVGVPAAGLERTDEPAGLPESLEAAREAARTRDPAVRAAEHAARAAAHAVRAAAAQAGLRVDLTGSLTRRDGDARRLGLADESSEARVGIALSLPLYQGGAVGARVREARRTEARRRGELAAARRDAMHRATVAWRGLAAARQRRAALEAAVAASRVALSGLRREAEIGERTTQEVLYAERSLVIQQIQALSAARDAAVEGWRLRAAAGALTARRLGVAGVPDLDREARDSVWDVAPVVPTLGLE